jgi:hypothetical protein
MARAYKLTNSRKEGIYKGGIVYGKRGKVEAKLDKEATQPCAAGINLATLQWCLKELSQAGDSPHLFMYSFALNSDNACCPIGSDGKFRVGEATLVGECDFKGRLIKEG